MRQRTSKRHTSSYLNHSSRASVSARMSADVAPSARAKRRIRLGLLAV